MASQPSQLHFVLFPLMAQGHLIPATDIARLLAQHGMIVSIITTPLNAARLTNTLARLTESGLQIQLIEVHFPWEKVDLPEGCQNFDMLPSLGKANSLFSAACFLQQPAEKVFEGLTPRPSCIISDSFLPWTSNIAKKYGIPRIFFNGMCCFCNFCMKKQMLSGILESITSDTEHFVIPGLPDIEWTKGQLPTIPITEDFRRQIRDAQNDSFGTIINTFEELERPYVEEYKRGLGKKVWCIGPVTLCNKDSLDKLQRGDKPSADAQGCLKWLDSRQPGSVVYVCLGSLNNLILPQLVELGLGLEAANRPFIWVLRKGYKSKELQMWISESGFEERIKGRGLIVKGWAPQVLILSHPSIGGFLTHCGWNSTLEGICAGVPMVTWPLFGDQFCNEKLVVHILKIGVRVGVEFPEKWGEEEQIGVLVKREDVTKAVDRLMKEGEERQERTKRAQELAEMAKKAVEEGGSSYLNMKLLIQDIYNECNIRSQLNQVSDFSVSMGV